MPDALKLRALLTSAAAALPFANAAAAQDASATQAVQQPPQSVAAQPADEDDEMGNDIVVTGQRPRGSVVGDIPPENVLTSRDVRATGATSITELLDALAPQIGSARGRGGEQPVMLLNGQRISGFREIRDIPTEAIERVEILPEEVALKYGYRADQRVVNIVLRRRFRSTALRGQGTTATDGGYLGGLADVSRLMIGDSGRTTINLHAEGNTALKESERDIDFTPITGSPDFDPRASRTLIGSSRMVRGAVTRNQTILGDVSATINGELQHSDGQSLLGFPTDSSGNPLILLDPRARDTSSDSAHAGVALNWDKAKWHWSVTGNADLDRDVTRTDPRDTSVDERDRARTTTTSAGLDATANGKLFALPAGDASTTVRVGISTLHLDGTDLRLGETTSNSLGRTDGSGSVSLDLPISRRNRDFSALGNLTLNANAEVEQLSDFGTLTTIGAGFNASPVQRLNIIASWTREEGAPTVQQLGNPILETPGSRIFDFTTGETVLATAVTGGNPDLEADRRNVVKLGFNWQPFEKTDLRLRADYVHSDIKRPIQNIFGPTPALEAAFPDRFERESVCDADGNCHQQLVRADLRPVNFESARRDTIRVGFDFTKSLRSKRPPQALIDQFRSRFGTAPSGAGARPRGAPSTEGAPPPPPDGPPPGGFGGPGGWRGGGGGGGGFFGGRNGGRLQFSLTDTITLVDEAVIRSGLPKLDYLDGDAAGNSGGTPRHLVEAQGGWFNNGFGVRASANWRSGTRVDSIAGDSLRFSPLATFDLRLFANPGDRLEWAVKHPWLRGTQLRLEVNNILNSRPKVRDAFGDVPLSYQPDLLDPLGRTISVSIRKLFLPPPSFFRRTTPPTS